MTTFIQPPFWQLSRGRIPMRAAAMLVTPAIAIASSSVANPTIITTTVPHGLASGDEVTIDGHAGSTPTVNGARTATVLTATTFTVPVDVSVGGTGGTVTRTTPTPVITLAEAKLHTKIGADVTIEDTLIAAWTKAATEQVENDAGLKLLTQTWDFVADRFPSEDLITLPWGPLQRVVSVQSYDSAGVLQTMSASDYLADTISIPGRIGLADAAVWPSDLRVFQPVVLRVIVGYDAIAKIPAPLIQAVRLAMAWHAANREPTGLELDSYNWLLDPYRPVVVA
jgi:uncharacterized phiE125 gp8 family phage protein